MITTFLFQYYIGFFNSNLHILKKMLVAGDTQSLKNGLTFSQELDYVANYLNMAMMIISYYMLFPLKLVA